MKVRKSANKQLGTGQYVFVKSRHRNAKGTAVWSDSLKGQTI